jgi:hypothetical protein
MDRWEQAGKIMSAMITGRISHFKEFVFFDIMSDPFR